MTANEKSLFYDTVCQFEGFRSRSYRCPSGVLTIGYGHTKDVKPSDIVTPFEAKKLLESDFDDVFTTLKSFNFNLKENELFAIADFVFNLGIGTLIRSSIFRLLNDYSFSHSDSLSNHYKNLICKKIEEFVYYTDKHGVKRKSNGLVKRRQFESTLFRKID